MTGRILIVDDETNHVQALCDALGAQGYHTEGHTSARKALDALKQDSFDLLLTDLMMPEIDGIELLRSARKVSSSLVGIVMTGMGTIETAIEAMKAGAFDYVLKPIRLRDILPVLKRALEVRRLRFENVQLKSSVAIHELTHAIALTFDEAILLNKICDAAMTQFGADEASVMLLSDDGKSLRVAAVTGAKRQQFIGTQTPVGEGIAGQVAQRREPLMMSGDASEFEVVPQFPRHEIVAALCLPMLTRGELVGVLSLNFMKSRGTFTRGEVAAFDIFTTAAAGAIEAAKLYRKERRTDVRYGNVLKMAGNAIISLDSDFRIQLFNAAAERIFGWPAEAIIGKPLDLLLPKRLRERHRTHLLNFESSPDTQIPMQGRGPFVAVRRDGSEFPIEASISKHREEGKPVYTVVVNDITERVQHEARIARLTKLYSLWSEVNSTIVRMRSENELFQEICQIATTKGGFMSACVCMTNTDGEAAQVVAHSGPVARNSLISVLPGYLEPLSPSSSAISVQCNNNLEDDESLDAERREMFALGARSEAIVLFELSGNARAAMHVFADVVDAFGEDEIRLMQELGRDVSFALESIAKTRRMEYLATHDEFTGLPNRALFLYRLGQTLRHARKTNSVSGVVLSDIVRFRYINDTFGKQAGDEVLRQFARRFDEIFGRSTGLARIGANIFAAIFTEVTHPEALARVVREKIAGLTSKPFDVGGNSIRLACRSGIAVFPADGNTAEVLLGNAEAALSRGKTAREDLVLYTPDLNARVAEQFVMENKLRQALERDEFVLFYQPKIDAVTGELAGAEALIRWNDPEAGLVPPVKFIPLLEETGLILEAGAWAIREAARTAQRFARRGSRLRVAVNISAIQLREAGFVNMVLEGIAAGGNSADHGLDIEITESAVIDDIDANLSKLEMLRNLGVGVAMDDFGTGYSSLAYIARLPVDAIKIDRTFVKGLPDDLTSQSIVTAIIALAHGLGRTVVAEGVETDAQAEYLRTLGCDQFQGYLYGRPVSMAEFEQHVLSGNKIIKSA